MHQATHSSLGETWLDLLRRTVASGSRLGDEACELLNVQAAFAADGPDHLLERLGDRGIISEMRKVFFTEEPNIFGHNYAARMRGPAGRRDLQDIIALLRADPLSKRAVLTLAGTGDGEVPCINAIQFLVRFGRLETVYFARGQDIYQKFYADGVCLSELARRITNALTVPAGSITGFISSLHVYDRDLPAIRKLLAEVDALTLATNGGC